MLITFVFMNMRPISLKIAFRNLAFAVRPSVTIIVPGVRKCSNLRTSEIIGIIEKLFKVKLSTLFLIVHWLGPSNK